MSFRGNKDGELTLEGTVIAKETKRGKSSFIDEL